MALRLFTCLLVMVAAAGCVFTSEDARGFRCSAEDQCDPRWTCVEGACRPRCSSATDCYVGQDCVRGGCVPVNAPGSSSAGGSTSADRVSSSASLDSSSADIPSSGSSASAPSSSVSSVSASGGLSSSRGPVYTRNLIYVGGGGGAALGANHLMQVVIPAGPAASPSPRMSVGPLTTVESR